MRPDLFAPIPPLADVRTDREVVAHEAGESLVDLAERSGGAISCRPAYANGAHNASRACAVREGVCERLLRAQELLPPGIRIAVLDAWRPLSLQRRLFDAYAGELRSRHPEWPEGRAEEEAGRFVTDPYRHVPPHTTGGAVDVALLGGDGEMLAFGSDFDEFSDRSATRWFETLAETRELDPEELEALSNRRMLYNAMTLGGMTNYPREWWHFDYGDALWAQVVHASARYGPLDAAEDG